MWGLKKVRSSDDEAAGEAAPSWDRIEWSEYRHEAQVGGRRLRYVDYGDGPPLLLIHGMGGSWESWLANIPALGEQYRVIAVDLPGFGGSDVMDEGADFGGYLDALAALLDELGIPAVALFGHSLGGLVALSFAAAHPGRVRCLVLVSGGGARLSRVRLLAIQLVFRLFCRVFAVPGMRHLLLRSPLRRLVFSLAVHDTRRVPGELLEQMVPRRIGPGMVTAISLSGRQLRALDLRHVVAPVLLVWGHEDRILTLDAARQLGAQLQQSQLVVLDDVGHCAMFEAPDEFHVLAENFLFLQGLDRRPASGGRASAHAWTAALGCGADDRTERFGNGTAG